jgi:REP-associated tyrosine transposase
MSRQRRIFIAGLSLHVIHRGHNGGPLFADDEDCERFLVLLRSAVSGAGVDIHGYALMKTHDHLLVTPQREGALSSAMRSLGVRYVRYFNRKYQRMGTLFNERYRGIHIEDERYWFNCLRYIEQNPVRAGLVATADAYKWSSYAVHGGNEESSWLAPHHVYTALAATEPERRTAYHRLCGQPLTDAEIAEQRVGTDPGRSQVRPSSVPSRTSNDRVSSGSATDVLAV